MKPTYPRGFDRARGPPVRRMRAAGGPLFVCVSSLPISRDATAILARPTLQIQRRTDLRCSHDPRTYSGGPSGPVQQAGEFLLGSRPDRRHAGRVRSARWRRSGRGASGWTSTGRSSSAWAVRWRGTRLHVKRLEATVRTYLGPGRPRDRRRGSPSSSSGRGESSRRTETQLRLHEQAYENNLLKIKHAGGKLAEIRNKIARYDADLKMSAAEAEIAKVAQQFNFDVHTDFGQIEGEIQDRIDLNRAKVRVAVDLSGEGVETIRQEEAVRDQLAEDILKDFEQPDGALPGRRLARDRGGRSGPGVPGQGGRGLVIRTRPRTGPSGENTRGSDLAMPVLVDDIGRADIHGRIAADAWQAIDPPCSTDLTCCRDRLLQGYNFHGRRTAETRLLRGPCRSSSWA